MNDFKRFEIRPINNKANEFELIIIMDDYETEFAAELGSRPETKKNLIQSAKSLIVEQYPDIKISVVRVMMSGMICATFPISTVMASTQSSNSQEDSVHIADGAVKYTVQPGDTLWILSQRYNTKIDLIKRANHLSADTLKVGQQIIIPKAIHTVMAGEYLSTLAKQFSTTIEAIKEANQLSDEKILIGQELVIPNDIIKINTEPNSTTFPTQSFLFYKVMPGDSLFLLAKRFNTTVEEIRHENGLTSDVISLGQLLKLPPEGMKEHQDNSEPLNKIPEIYTVKPGDTLLGIAKQHNLSVNFIMINNQLKNEFIQSGQILRLKENYIKGDRKQIGTVKILRPIEVYSKHENGTLKVIRTLPKAGVYNAYSIDYDHNLYHVGGNQWVKISPDIQFTRVGEKPSPIIYSKSSNSTSNIIHIVVSGDNIWNLSVKYGIPQSELLKVNKLNLNSSLQVGQRLIIPQYNIAVKTTPSARHGEHLDWWTEAQYVVPIGKVFKVTDFATGKSFMVKRTIGANHADCETVTLRDSTIAKEIWKGYSWTERAVIIEVDGRKIAASMSFMPHDIEFINNNGIRGHFDIHFKNSTRHKDGKIDNDHQRQVNIAAGVKNQ